MTAKTGLLLERSERVTLGLVGGTSERDTGAGGGLVDSLHSRPPTPPPERIQRTRSDSVGGTAGQALAASWPLLPFRAHRARFVVRSLPRFEQLEVRWGEKLKQPRS